MNRLFALLPILAPLLGSPSSAAPPALGETVMLGSTKLVVEQDSALEMVYGHLALSAGSICEPEGKKGLATLMARMLTRSDLSDWLETRSGALSSSIDLDSIHFSFTCAPTDLEETIARLRGLFESSDYETGAVAAARTEFLRELEREQSSVSGVADRAVERLLFGRFSSYARIPNIDDVRSLTAADLQSFHRTHVGANRITCALVGPLSDEKATLAVRGGLAGLEDVDPRPADPTPPIYSPYRTFIYVVDVPDADHTEIRLAAPGVIRSNATQCALELWRWTASMGADSRLHKDLIETKIASNIECGFDSEWSRMGTFRGAASTPNKKAGETLQAFMGVLQEHRRGEILPTEIEAGQERFANHEALQAADPSERAKRLAQVAFYEYPAAHYEQYSALTQFSNKKRVVGALTRSLLVRRMIIVAAGPADKITEALEYFTDTKPFTFDAPASDPTAAAEVERMFEALGGAQLWADLKGVELTSEIEVMQSGETRTRTVHLWRNFDSAFYRSDQKSLREETSAIDGLPGWVHGELGIRLMSNVKYRVQVLNTRRWLYSLLHSLALPNSGIVATRGEEDRIVFSDWLGEICWLKLAENGRPERMGFVDTIGDQNVIYKNWSKSGDYMYCRELLIPYAYYETQGDFPRTIKSFVPNPTFDRALFKRPARDS